MTNLQKKRSENQLESQTPCFETKLVDDSGAFSGYGAVFNNTDNGGDIILPGAFAKNLSDWRAKGKWPKMLWGHDPDMPIGMWTEMREDSHGLYVEGKLFIKDVQKARETYTFLKAGALDGLSIGYRTVAADRTDTGLRHIKEVELWEVSVVSFPMNTAASVTSVKNFNPRTLERALRDEANLSSNDAVMVVGILKKHLQSDSGDTTSSSDRDGLDEGMNDLLALIRATKADLQK